MDARRVFFLGGNDLEMITIRGILKEKGISFVDKGLSWNNATLSKYSDVLEQYKDYYIYGIELKNDLEEKDIPSHYYAIDHHNELFYRPSSLEQVADLLGYTLSDREQLIAANDKGYIPAMQAMGATKDQIAEIRQLDRLAQGVTNQEYEKALNSLSSKETFGNLIIVRTASKIFSPITDELYPYKSLLVVSVENRCFCFYGYGSQEMHNTANALWSTFSGGGKNGFWGGDLKTIVQDQYVETEIESLIDAVKHNYSKIQ